MPVRGFLGIDLPSLKGLVWRPGARQPGRTTGHEAGSATGGWGACEASHPGLQVSECETVGHRGV